MIYREIKSQNPISRLIKVTYLTW